MHCKASRPRVAPPDRRAPASPRRAASCGCSCGVADERPELIVGDERALPRPELLHAREQLGTTLLGHVEVQLLGLDANRVDAALLAEDEAALRTDELRRVRLDR